VHRVKESLVATLEHMCGSQLEQRAKNQIPTLVHGFGILALQMASQRSHIMLEPCEHGTTVVAKKFKVDDGNAEAQQFVVDLMTQPCMVRIGDGQGDLAAEMVLVQGDVVAMSQGYGQTY
jgi:hypothetical protein